MIKIALIVPKNLINEANEAAEMFYDDINILAASMSKGVRLARELEKEGYDIIIARGGTQILISQSNLRIPIVAVPITPLDIFKAIERAETIDRNIAFIAFNNMLPATESYTKISDKSLPIIQVKNEVEVEEKLKELKINGYNVVVGGGILSKYAPIHDMKEVIINSGKEAFVSAIEEAKRIVQATRKEKESKERIRAIIDHSQDGVVCVDKEGYINIFNKPAEKLLKIYQKEAIGKKVNRLFPELELEDTIFNGVEETNIVKKIKGTKMIVSKIPIIVNDEIVDSVAMLRNIDDIQKMEEKIRQDIAVTGHYAKYTFDDIINYSKKSKESIRIGKEYARVDSTILIEGETGTGKEVMAQSIHNFSDRSERPFVAVNCAALPENLLESELFGYAPGAFTGADRKGKRGLFEVAHEGTIFLDEISQMDPLLQGRLLRAIQEKKIMRVGDNKLIPVDVRIIAATNEDLYNMVKKGNFREDLYYRLNVLKIHLVPLRKRKEDILYFLDYFMKFYGEQLGKKDIKLSNDAKEYLYKYDWPGNVREIKNFVERLIVITKKDIIEYKDIKNQISLDEKGINHLENEEEIPNNYQQDNFNLNLDDMEIINIKLALKNCNGNIKKASKELGISRTTLWRRMKKHNIEVAN